MNFVNEIIGPLANWRMIYLRAIQSVGNKFARSKLGQFWITLSLSFLIAVLGFVWALIWQVELDAFLPYLASGYVIYIFLASVISESCMAIIEDEKFYIDRPYSLFLSTYVLLARNLVVFAYNVPIIFLVVAWSDSASFAISFMYPLYVALILFLLFFGSFSIALLSVYFRDLLPLIGSVMSVTFLMTPVMWNPSMIPPEYQTFIYINPFACMLELLRNPLIGQAVSTTAIYATAIWCAAAFAASWLAWRRYYRNAIYWI